MITPSSMITTATATATTVSTTTASTIRITTTAANITTTNITQYILREVLQLDCAANALGILKGVPAEGGEI